MAFQDRDYYRQPPPPPRGGSIIGHPRMWSFTTWLIAINVTVFVIDALLIKTVGVYQYAPGVHMGPLEFWGHFSAGAAIGKLQVWRFITFQFLHSQGNVLHIVFNMLGLYIFGPMVERYLGSWRYLGFYLLCGIAGAAFYFMLLLTPLMSGVWVPMVGASAGVYGVVVAAAVIAPNVKVMLLFPPIPMKLKTMVLIFLGMAVFTVLTRGRNAGGEAAHIGGAALGYLAIHRAHLLDWRAWFKRKPAPTGAPPIPGRSGGGLFSGLREAQQRRRAEQEREEAKEVDRILDKVHREGLGSLTDKEKRLLQRATDRQR